MKNNKLWIRRRKRIHGIIQVGSDFDICSRIYDYTNALAIILNLSVTVLYTFTELRESWSGCFLVIEKVTVGFFAVDYILRLWTARFLYPNVKESSAILKYICSFSGIVDLLSFLPDILPIFIPGGTVALRMIRIVRIFRLFRVNAYHDSLSVIAEVLIGKKQQLFSSVFMILVLMIASTLLTVGYGDIYPITMWGKIFGIFITFLGVGMVAIPTGIISAGFVDQYTRIKRKSQYGYEADMNFIKIPIKETDEWVGKRVADLELPAEVIIAVIQRKEELIIPRGEVVLREENPWIGVKIKDLDISRHSVIVLVKRRNKALIPNGNMMLEEDDHIFLYTHHYLTDVNIFEI